MTFRYGLRINRQQGRGVARVHYLYNNNADIILPIRFVIDRPHTTDTVWPLPFRR